MILPYGFIQSWISTHTEEQWKAPFRKYKRFWLMVASPLPSSLSSSANKSRSEGCPTEWRSDCVALEGGLQCKTSETPSSFAATTTGCILARHSLCSFVLLMQRAASTDPLCWAWYFVENGNVAICFCMLWYLTWVRTRPIRLKYWGGGRDNIWSEEEIDIRDFAGPNRIYQVRSGRIDREKGDSDGH